jgi:hypothetical protein
VLDGVNPAAIVLQDDPVDALIDVQMTTSRPLRRNAHSFLVTSPE